MYFRTFIGIRLNFLKTGDKKAKEFVSTLMELLWQDTVAQRGMNGILSRTEAADFEKIQEGELTEAEKAALRKKKEMIHQLFSGVTERSNTDKILETVVYEQAKKCIPESRHKKKQRKIFARTRSGIGLH